MEFVECYIDGQKLARDLAEEHHVTPQAAHGTDGQTVFLCAGCHSTIHTLANKLKAGKQSIYLDLLSQGFTSVSQRKRAQYLIQEISRALALKAAGELPPTDHKVNLILEHEVFIGLQSVARRYKHKGRPLGLNRYIRLLIHKDFRNRGIDIPFDPF